MARGDGGGIPGNDLGQGSASTGQYQLYMGVSGAPTGAVGGAADARRPSEHAIDVHHLRMGHGSML